MANRCPCPKPPKLWITSQITFLLSFLLTTYRMSLVIAQLWRKAEHQAFFPTLCWYSRYVIQPCRFGISWTSDHNCHHQLKQQLLLLLRLVVVRAYIVLAAVQRTPSDVYINDMKIMGCIPLTNCYHNLEYSSKTLSTFCVMLESRNHFITVASTFEAGCNLHYYSGCWIYWCSSLYIVNPEQQVCPCT